MSQPAGNPYEPPRPAAELPIGLVPGGADRVTSITFRYSEDDLRRAATKPGRPTLIAAILSFAAASAIGPYLFDEVRGAEFNSRVANLATVSAGIALPLLGLSYLIAMRFRGSGASEAPFETTMIVSAEGLKVRESGIADLHRTWPSIAEVSHDRDLIRFVFLVFDASSGTYSPRTGAIAPIRAFATEADAASFVAAAREYREAAGPSIDRR
ncbi:hypothetical protein [Tautonia plasticadhaerens]|uniref:YcxB-like protein domain-containing protein n=1 Tax=Tautonia plasticadhaerens TaxID=2527974 RepID=A0A518H894_9BACT|nr:hypothetical protein [Tautonia plasticadhaerens]QDV37021.1 hypothetical protein ElP_49540 [Tautonia plasticadhaerens]